MRKIVNLLLLISITLLAGCGQRGPLYFPSEETQPTTSVEQTTSSQTKGE